MSLVVKLEYCNLHMYVSKAEFCMISINNVTRFLLDRCKEINARCKIFEFTDVMWCSSVLKCKKSVF